MKLHPHRCTVPCLIFEYSLVAANASANPLEIEMPARTHSIFALSFWIDSSIKLFSVVFSFAKKNPCARTTVTKSKTRIPSRARRLCLRRTSASDEPYFSRPHLSWRKDKDKKRAHMSATRSCLYTLTIAEDLIDWVVGLLERMKQWYARFQSSLSFLREDDGKRRAHHMCEKFLYTPLRAKEDTSCDPIWASEHDGGGYNLVAPALRKSGRRGHKVPAKVVLYASQTQKATFEGRNCM